MEGCLFVCICVTMPVSACVHAQACHVHVHLSLAVNGTLGFSGLLSVICFMSCTK